MEFAGFFSADAIEAAIRQAAGKRSNSAAEGDASSADDEAASDEDSDGT